MRERQSVGFGRGRKRERWRVAARERRRRGGGGMIHHRGEKRGAVPRPLSLCLCAPAPSAAHSRRQVARRPNARGWCAEGAERGGGKSAPACEAFLLLLPRREARALVCAPAARRARDRRASTDGSLLVRSTRTDRRGDKGILRGERAGRHRRTGERTNKPARWSRRGRETHLAPFPHARRGGGAQKPSSPRFKVLS